MHPLAQLFTMLLNFEEMGDVANDDGKWIVVFGMVAAWTVVEFVGGSVAWGVFFAALSAYVGWGFFLSGQPDEPGGEGE